jgi:hypothetical protein
VTLVVSLLLEQRDVMRIGVLLVVLPLLSALLVARTRYKLASARGLRPTRVAVDSPATSVIRIENVSRLPSGLVLVEDSVPWQLGRPQRFVVDRLEPGGRRDVRYELRARCAAGYTIGPSRCSSSTRSACAARRGSSPPPTPSPWSRAPSRCRRSRLSGDWSGSASRGPERSPPPARTT